MPETYSNYIDGDWRASDSGDTFTVTNPADTDDVVGEFQQSSSEDVAGAIEAAAGAQEGWADTPAQDRGKILRETARRLDDRKEELTETLTREEGKALSEARPEVQRAIDIFYYYAEKAPEFVGTVKAYGRDSNLYTVREPMGVSSLVVPWNYPIAIPTWKLVPALATGNTAVLKPAMNAPDIYRKVFECLDEAGLPDGVANFVTGSGSEIGDTLVEHDRIDVVSFTGSRSIGERVYDKATADGKRVQTEMGSKNPTVVMASADLDEAAEIVGNAAFGVTGQACTATSRAIVHEDVHDQFLELLVEYAEGLDIGPGLDDPDMGPHVSQDELDGTLDYVDVGRDEGATLETGGSRLEDGEYENGFFVEPTVFSDVESDMRIAQEEIFGPVVGVIPVADFDEALAVANDVEFGLSAGIITHDHTEANRYVDEVDFGVIKINETTTGLEYHVPFGGMNASSSETYREQGEAGMDFFTITKTVYENY